ncbi:MAG TPA: metallophosphoesterase [Planktothrix sp.]|jgi:hypothetical protein
MQIALMIVLLIALAAGLVLWARTRAKQSCGCNQEERQKQPQVPAAADPAHQVETFLIKPYVQLGTEYGSASDGTLEIVWHAQDEEKTVWTAVVRSQSDLRKGFKTDIARAQITITKIAAMSPVPGHNQHRALVTDRWPGERFTYDLYRNSKLVFSASTMAPKTNGVSHRFIAVGDIADSRPGQAKIAYQMQQFKPDFVVVPGDIAYKRGRLSENIEKYFPIMNNDESSPEKGAPLMRSVPFASVLGNHDYGCPDAGDVPNLDEHQDLFAWFYLWSQPLNGPEVSNCHSRARVLRGTEAEKQAFLTAAGHRYPRMANCSFDYGDVHWLFLDANPHMDWSCEDLRSWVRQDLMGTRCKWKFVVFHQPGFTSHRRHGVEQRMRLVADVFQDCGVTLVFNGHAHWYERLYPLKFALKAPVDGRAMTWSTPVDGEFVLDKNFDGVMNTRPDGVIYIVTGGGGAKLQATDLAPAGWAPFTHKLISDRHSFSVVDVEPNKVTLRQISEDGDELDRFVVTK